MLYGNMILKTVRVLHSFGVMSVYESSTDGNFVGTVLWLSLKKLLLRERLFSSCEVVGLKVLLRLSPTITDCDQAYM